MMTQHTYRCPFCGEQFTEECAVIGGRIIKPESCERCSGKKDEHKAKMSAAIMGRPIAAQSTVEKPERDLGPSWPERHVSGLADYGGVALGKAKALWSSHVSQRPCTLVLHGPRGRGKTGMATWWAWMRGQSGRHPGLYATAYELFARIRRSWHPSSELAEWDALKPYQRTPYLAIDQLHQCRALSDGSDKAALWERMALAELLDYRYREGKTTILIATVETKEELKQSLDADILDRVNESGGTINCNWESYRA